MAEYRELTEGEYAAALERGRVARTPRALSARYDRGRGRIVVRLDTGLELGFAPRDAQGLEHANAPDLADIEIVGAGSGLHFPKLDADLSIAGLLEGRLGSDAWMAARRPVRIA
jgi:hypothetical protein